MSERRLVAPKFYCYHLLPDQCDPSVVFDTSRWQKYIMTPLPHLTSLYPCVSTVYFVESIPTHRLLEFDTVRSSEIDFDCDRHCDERVRDPYRYIRTVNRLRYNSKVTLDERRLKPWLKEFRTEKVMVFAHMFRKFKKFSNAYDQMWLEKVYDELTEPSRIIKDVVRAARTYLNGSYACYHIRYARDFRQEHIGHPLYTSTNISNLLENFVRVTPTLSFSQPVYYSTDHEGNRREIENELYGSFSQIKSLRNVLESVGMWDTLQTKYPDKRDQQHVIFAEIDQQLCARANVFVGSAWSSFSERVCRIHRFVRHSTISWRDCISVEGLGFSKFLL